MQAAADAKLARSTPHFGQVLMEAPRSPSIIVKPGTALRRLLTCLVRLELLMLAARQGARVHTGGQVWVGGAACSSIRAQHD